MNAIILENNSIKLKSYNVEFQSKYDKREGVQIISQGSSHTLTPSKKYNQAYINLEENLNDIYFISYNNISDFTCGYSTKSFYEQNYFNLNDISFKAYSDSPFELEGEVEIKEMKIISNYRYAYYIIYNKETTETYYGLFDIKTNKIMFNTNEALETFLPYSNNSMLAIKGNSVYRICPIICEDGKTCLEDCDNDKLIIRDIDKNFCGRECPNNKYLLVPDNFCQSLCDKDIYVIDEENKKCGLCKSMNTEKPYKFIGGNICLGEDEIPEGAYVYNVKLKLLKCNSGYKTDPSNKNKCIIEKLVILTSELISTNEEYFTSSSEFVSDSFKNGNDIIDIKTNKNTIIYNTLDNAFSSELALTDKDYQNESSEFINDIVFSSQENNHTENKNEISQNVITSELILISEEYYTSSSEFIKDSIINEEYQTKNMTNINMINNTMNYIFSSELSFLNESSELMHNIELTTQENNLIENKTKIIQNIINNLITDFDINYLINFTDRKKYYNNLFIYLFNYINNNPLIIYLFIFFFNLWTTSLLQHHYKKFLPRQSRRISNRPMVVGLHMFQVKLFPDGHFEHVL